MGSPFFLQSDFLRKTKNMKRSGLIYLANAAAIQGDWIQLCPYGEFGHEKGVQVMSREVANALVLEYEATMAHPSLKLGVPVYVGHPDADPRTYKDTNVYGRVKKLEARPDGLYANVKWNEDGRKLIENEAYACASVFWLCDLTEDGKRMPSAIKSVGLTNSPNLPVQAITLANEKNDEAAASDPGDKGLAERKRFKQLISMDNATDEEAEATFTEMKALVLGLLGLKPEATGPEIVAALKTAKPLAAVEGSLANERRARETAEARFVTLENDLKSARTAAATLLIDNAITNARIPLGDRARWEQEFANDYTMAARRLAEERGRVVPLKTTARTEGCGTRRPQSADVQGLVNERMRTHRENYEVAFRQVMKTRPELFAN